MTGRHLLASVGVALSAFVLIAGCSDSGNSPGNTGTHTGNGLFTPGPPPPPLPIVPGNPLLTATLLPNPGGAFIGQDAHALTIAITNSSTETATISAITITASGTCDESTIIKKVSLINDQNLNGIVNGAEPTIASRDPGFTINDGTCTFNLTPPLTIAPQTNGINTVVQLIVTVELIDGTGLKDQLPLAGQTIAISIASNLSFDSLLTQRPIYMDGVYPLDGVPCTISVWVQKLISEVLYNSQTGGDFIEFCNPTGGPQGFGMHYLTDYTEDGPINGLTRFYYLRPQAAIGTFLFGPVSATAATETDFSCQFGNGAPIPPGGFQTVAVDGVGFMATHGVAPTYALRNAAAVGATQMLIWGGNGFVQGDVGPAVDLRDLGEPVMLFFWNEQGDLMQDVDIVGWGTPGPTAPGGDPNENTMVTKTGATCEGPDADLAFSPYAPETTGPNMNQQRMPLAPPGQSMQRVRYDEQLEIFANGNAQNQHDETSERWAQNFTNAIPTPGAP
jgi:hypothetical protein